MEDRGLRSATQPKVAVVSVDDGRDLEFNVELELLPEVTMPDFSSLHLTRLRATPPAESIDKALGEIASRQRTLVPVEEDRAAEIGDTLTVDFIGRVDGVAFPGGTGTDLAVELGGAGFIPGFSEGMVGMRPGETRMVEVTFPAEYQAKELAGKQAVFEITAKALQRGVPAEVGDDLAQKLGVENLEKMRELIAGQMQREYDGISRMRIKRDLLDKLSEQASFPAPEGMVESEFSQIWARVESDRKDGGGDEEDRGKDDDTLKAEYRAIAERRVRLGLLLSEVGRVNGIQVQPDELTRAMRAEAGRYPGQEQQVMEFFRKNPQAADGLRGPIFEDKVVDFVLELAQVEERQVAPEELSAEPAAPAKADASAEPKPDAPVGAQPEPGAPGPAAAG